MLTVWSFSQRTVRSRRKAKVVAGVVLEITLYSHLHAQQAEVFVRILNILKR